MQAPQSGEYQRGGVTLTVVRRGAIYEIVADGQTFTFNEAGILMAAAPAKPATADDNEDLQESRPRVKIPKPPRWP